MRFRLPLLGVFSSRERAANSASASGSASLSTSKKRASRTSRSSRGATSAARTPAFAGKSPSNDKHTYLPTLGSRNAYAERVAAASAAAAEASAICEYRRKLIDAYDAHARAWQLLNADVDSASAYVRARTERANMQAALHDYYAACGGRSPAGIEYILAEMEAADEGFVKIDEERADTVKRFETLADGLAQDLQLADEDPHQVTSVAAQADQALIEVVFYRDTADSALDSALKATLDKVQAVLLSVAQAAGDVHLTNPVIPQRAQPLPPPSPPPPDRIPHADYPPPAPRKGRTSRRRRPPVLRRRLRKEAEESASAAPEVELAPPGSYERYLANAQDGPSFVPPKDHTTPRRPRQRSSSPSPPPTPPPAPIVSSIEGTDGGSGHAGSGSGSSSTSESGEELPSRMLLPRMRTLRDVAELALSFRGAPPTTSPEVVEDALGMPGTRSADKRPKTLQPAMSFSSALYNTSNAREDVISDEGVILHHSKVEGDGRCLFRSVARGRAVVKGESVPNSRAERTIADNLRRKAVAELKRNKPLLMRFYVIEENFENYIERMSQKRTFGGEPELLMLAKVLRTPIAVYVVFQGRFRRIQLYGKQYRGDPIRILYSNGTHYDALIPTSYRGRR